MLKYQPFKTSEQRFDNSLLGHERFSGLSRNRHQGGIRTHDLCLEIRSHDLLFLWRCSQPVEQWWSQFEAHGLESHCGQSFSLPSCGPISLSTTNAQMAWFGDFLALRLKLLKALANEDTLLPTQMFPRLPARAAFVADTKFVSGTQKVFLIFVAATNVSQFAQHGNTTFILCPAFLRAQETSWATMRPQQCPLLPGP